ncbi:MAG TPA: glycosyltransferase family 4 protein [Actinomycetota bacterium]|nr:glycosyltransferase family 4 protein [Actinomycetota bacterium]
MTVASVHLVIGAYPPSLGGAQLHTAALVDALSGALGVSARVSCLWRETRHDWLLGSTIRLPEGREVVVEDGVSIERVGLSGRHPLRDALAASAYYALPRQSAAYFARRLDFRDGDEPLVHVVRLGREHLAVRALEDARTRGVPVVLTPNHHPRWSRRPGSSWNDVYRKVDHVFALTNAEREELTRLGVARDRITVTGIGPILSDEVVSRADFLDALRLPDRRYLGFLGQQFDYKRLDVVVDAFDLLAAEDPQLGLVIAGPTATATRRYRERSPHKDRISIVGPLPLVQKTAFLRYVDVLLFPSQQESFGGVLIEAAAVGTPFVTSDIPPLAEVAAELGNGTSSPVSPRGVADAAAALLDGEAPAPNEAAVDRYSWPRLAALYRDVYDGLAGT